MRLSVVMFIFLITGISSLFGDNRELFNTAADFYASEKYQKAANTYEKILKNGFESPELFYNLGNCYYRLNNYPEAVYYYEKAKLLSPADEDILHNLSLAESKIYDKIKPKPKAALVRMAENFIAGFSPRFWALLSLFAFVTALSGLSLYLFAASKKNKIRGFSLSLLFLVPAIIGFIISQQQYSKIIRPNAGVIFSEAVSVKSSPDENATELFIIHEGLKVETDEHKDNWVEIRLTDGRVGWVRKNHIRLF